MREARSPDPCEAKVPIIRNEDAAGALTSCIHHASVFDSPRKEAGAVPPHKKTLKVTPLTFPGFLAGPGAEGAWTRQPQNQKGRGLILPLIEASGISPELVSLFSVQAYRTGQGKRR